MVGHDVKIPIFYVENINLWNMRMQGHLMSLGFDVYSIVVYGYVIHDFLPSYPDGNNIFQSNVNVINVILAGLSENEMIKFMHCKLDKEVWDKLENKYEGDSKVKKEKVQTYRMRFEILRMKEDETIGEYFQRVETRTNLIKSIHDKIEDEFIIQKILSIYQQYLTLRFLLLRKRLT